MKARRIALRRFGSFTAAISVAALLAASSSLSAASADPSPGPSLPDQGSTTAPTNGELTVKDILRANPDAKQVRAGVVNIAPGVDVILPPSDGSANNARAAADICDYYHLCVWEHALVDDFGAGLGFYDCQPSGSLINLGGMRYPDGAWVGTGTSGPKWNDRISMFDNNQTPGTATYFYNYTGSSWSNVLTSYAYQRVSNLRYSPNGNINDIIDGVHVCTS
ncbi:hypothetical protein [Micromonospora sp. NPDC047134]|uniref:hypothetical protein n=1 Tax=Micromonospora sp. NPDC047134 TaxID=3154340 RepID=UPI0033E692E2